MYERSDSEGITGGGAEPDGASERMSPQVRRGNQNGMIRSNGTCISLHIRWEQEQQIPNIFLTACHLFWDVASQQKAQRRDFIKLFGQAGPPSIAVCPISTCRSSYTIQPLLAAETIPAAVCVPLYKSSRVRSAAQSGFSLRHKRRPGSDFRFRKAGEPVCLGTTNSTHFRWRG